MKKLSDGFAEIAEGAKELAEGGSDLADGAKELMDGAAELSDGTAELRQHRTKTVSRLCVRLACIFSVILHQSSLKYGSIPASL